MLALADASADLLFRDAHTADRFAPDPIPDEQIVEIWISSNGGPQAATAVRAASCWCDRQKLASA